MTSPSVVIIVTLDTKEAEAAFIVEEVIRQGGSPVVIDVGVLGEPTLPFPGISHREVAEASGRSLEDVQSAGSRGSAVEMMQLGAVDVLKELHRNGRCDGALAIGGAEGAVMGAGALQSLPFGVPKLVVSPVLSGRRSFEPFVGVSDMLMMHSVVDLAGVNRISETILRNAVAALLGMCEQAPSSQDADRQRSVGITALGNTDACVKQLSPLLAEEGWSPIVFHSNGVGGRAMESQAWAGELQGIIDLTTNEIADELCGGLQAGGQERMGEVSKLGLPTVVGLACSDFLVLSSRSELPERFEARPVYHHNPEYLLVRLSGDEMQEVAIRIVEALNQGSGPLSVCFPGRGMSILNHEGGAFWDERSDRAFWDYIESELRPDARKRYVDAHVNDSRYSDVILEEFRFVTNQEGKHRNDPPS